MTTQMKDWTRVQQDTHVRSIERTCRGPLLVDPEIERVNFDRWYVLEELRDVDGVGGLLGELYENAKQLAAPGFKLGAVPALVVDPNDAETWEYLRRLVFPMIRLRGDKVGKPCGYDQNQIVVAHPYDGETRQVPCPDCDTLFVWTSPVFY